MPFVLPKNDSLIRNLTPFEQQTYVNTAKGAAELAAENPNLDTRVYTRFLNDYANAALIHRKTLDAKIANAKNAGVIPDQRWMNAESLKMRNDFVANFLQNTLPSYGPSGAEAWEKLGTRLKPKSIPEIAAGQFYNKEKGGVQWPGIIGGALAGFLVFKGLGGGLMGILGAVLGLVAGAWLTNGAAKTIGGFFGKKDDANKQAAGHGLKRTVTVPTPDVSQFKKPDLGTLVPNNMKAATPMQHENVETPDSFMPGTSPAKTTNANKEPKNPAAGAPSVPGGR